MDTPESRRRPSQSTPNSEKQFFTQGQDFSGVTDRDRRPAVFSPAAHAKFQADKAKQAASLQRDGTEAAISPSFSRVAIPNPASTSASRRVTDIPPVVTPAIQDAGEGLKRPNMPDVPPTNLNLEGYTTPYGTPNQRDFGAYTATRFASALPNMLKQGKVYFIIKHDKPHTPTHFRENLESIRERVSSISPATAALGTKACLLRQQSHDSP